MKKNYLTLALMLFLSVLQAQPTVTSSSFNFNIGDEFIMHHSAGTPTEIPPGPDGENVAWDISDIDFSSSTTTEQVLAADPNYPEANFSIFYGTTTAHVEVTGSEIWMHAFETPNATLEYSNPTLNIFFPMSYQDSYYNTFECTFTSNQVDFTRSGWETLTCDGYGTLTTPEGTVYNVLRYLVHQEYTDESDMMDIDYVVSTYVWVSPDYNYYIASVHSTWMSFDGSTSYGAMYNPGAPVSVERHDNNQLSFFPNPTSDNINFIFDQTNAPSVIQIHDLSGRLIETVEPHNGIGGAQLDVSSYKNGVYLVTSTFSNGTTSTKKFVKQ